MSDNAITPQQSFEENIKERLRKDIGGLIPDAALAEMVTKAISTIFFNRTEKQENSWSSHKTVIPSWFEQEIAKLLDARIKTEIDTYMKKEGEKLTDKIALHIAAEAPKIIAGIFVNFMKPSNNGYSRDFSSVVLDVLRNKGMNV